jgi:hypothetical protein
LSSWIDAWIRNVQNQLLTLTRSLTTQEMIQEFSVTKKPVSSTIPVTTGSSSKKKKKPTSQPTPQGVPQGVPAPANPSAVTTTKKPKTKKPKQPSETQPSGESASDFTFSNKGRQLMDVRRIRELESHFENLQQQILRGDMSVEDLNASLWIDIAAIISGTTVQSTLLQQLFYLIELTSSITTSATALQQRQEQPSLSPFDPSATTGTLNTFISLLNNPPKYKKGKIKNLPQRSSHTTIINKKVKVKQSESSGSVSTQATTIKISIKGGTGATTSTSSGSTPSPSALLLHGGDDLPGLDGDIEMQEHMMSALTRLYYCEQMVYQKQWLDLNQIEGGQYLVHIFYKWLQSLLSCKIPLPMDTEEDENANADKTIAPQPVEKVDATAAITVCTKNDLARKLMLFFVLRQMQNIRIVLSRPRHVQNFPSEASDVDMTSSHHHHHHQHHQLTQSPEDEQTLFENCTKLELLLSHLFFDGSASDNTLTEFGRLVLSGKEPWFIYTLVQETGRLISNIYNLAQRRYHQDLHHILQLVFKFLSHKEAQWVPVAQCIAQLASLNYTDLAKKSLLQLKGAVSSTPEAQKNSQLEELFDHITKVVQEQEQIQQNSPTRRNSPVTPTKGVSPSGGYNYYSSHISPSRKSPPGYHSHHYQAPHHGYHPYMTQGHTYGRNPYTPQHSGMHGFGNLPPQQSPTSTHPYSSNPYTSAVQHMQQQQHGYAYYPQQSPKQYPPQPSPQQRTDYHSDDSKDRMEE